MTENDTRMCYKSTSSWKNFQSGVMMEPMTEGALQAICCFVCDEEVAGMGVPLLMGHTVHSNTDLPTKIGQLLGEEFLVVVHTEDVLCRRCEVLLNHLDRLEVEVVLIKHQLTTFLQAKYQLEDSHQLSQEPTDVVSEDCSIMTEDTEHIVESNDGHEHVNNSVVDSVNKGMQSGDKVNVEIILEKNKSSKGVERNVNNYTCTACDFSGTSSSELKSHMTTCCQRSRFSCSMCNQSFSSNKGIQRHVMKQHLSTWICHFCDVEFSDEHEYTTHLGTHLTNSMGNSRSLQAKQSKDDDGKNRNSAQSATQVRQHYKCSICEYLTTSKECFNKHVRSHVILKLFKCEGCGKRFRNQELLMKHLKTCPQSESSTGSYCELEFSSVSDTVPHLESQNTLEENCSAREDILDVLGVQNSVSNELPLADCEKHSSLEEINDSESIQSSSEVDVFQCNICFETFISKLQFDDHEKVHNSKLFSLAKNVGQADENLDQKKIINTDAHSNTRDSYEEKTGSVFEEMPKRVDSDKNPCIEIGEESSLGTTMLNCFCGASFSDINQFEKHKTDEKHGKNMDIFKDSQCIINTSSNQILSLLNDSSEHIYGNNLMQTFENLNVGNASIDENGLVNIIACEDSGTSTKSLNEIHYVFDMGCGENISVVDSEEVFPSEQFENRKETLCFQEVKATVTSMEDANKKTFLCTVCGYHSSNLTALKIHFREHDIKSHLVETKENFLPNSKVALHFKTEKDSEKLICLHCFKKYEDMQTLNKHILDCHPSDLNYCNICGQTFPSSKELQVHEDIHSDKLRCDTCSQQFSKLKQLKHHKDMMHRDPHCRYCGKEILKAQTLKNHEMRHARDAGSFECDICKRVFKTKTGLRHHVATHTGEYKFCCDFCGRGFMSRMMMEEHRSMHTKEERYICDVCGRKFSFQSTYWIHRKWHDTPYPYKCNYCGRMFRHSSLLAVHKRKHTGERPYKCPQCSLTFPVGGTLKRHMILHTGVYPFNCDRCKRGFTTKHKYAAHLAKVHSDYDLLNSKAPQNDFKMVVREEQTKKQESDVSWQVHSDDTEQSIINFKLADLPENVPVDRSAKDELQCAVSSSVLVDNTIPTRVVEIVLDEGSQAMATVTLAEHGNMIPELWYHQ